MDFILVTMLSFGIFVEYSAEPAGNLNFACRNEEEYDMCRSPCEPTCESIRNGIRRRNCTQSCVAGCFCREGLVRARDRSCILPEECHTRIRPTCKENEEFQECGSPCAVNCSTINDPIFCTKPCHSGCFCKQDFVRDMKGNCVHPRNCYKGGHKQCPLNEHYVDCINFCNTCWENGECRNHYCTPGCDCKPGFYRNFYGQCVPAEECVTPYYDSPYPSFRGYCAENEIYTDCVNLCNDCIFKGRCHLEYYCEPGCDCKPGYFRNEREICVPEQFCFRKRPICPPDEQYYSCIPTCRTTCDTFSDTRAICHPSCNPGCFCKPGLVRRNDGKCVSPRNCPARNPTCPAGEAFYQCLPTCRTTCETLNTASGVCPVECRPGCFCQPGFVRNRNGRCVRPEDCQNYTTTDNILIDPRRGGANNEDITTDEDLTTTASSVTTEGKQDATDKPTQNDSQSPTTSLPVTTRITTSTITNNVSDGTDSVPPVTRLTSAGVNPVTSTTGSTSASDQKTFPTELASPVTNVMSTSNTQTSENTALSGSTTLNESTIPNINTQAVETSSTPTTEQSLTTKANNGQVGTTDTSTDSKTTENDLTLTSTVQP